MTRVADRVREELAESNPDAILFDGLDAAIVGTGRQHGMDEVAVYDEDLLLAALREQFKDSEDPDLSAQEWYGHNVECLYAGPGTPIIMRRPAC